MFLKIAIENSLGTKVARTRAVGEMSYLNDFTILPVYFLFDPIE